MSLDTPEYEPFTDSEWNVLLVVMRNRVAYTGHRTAGDEVYGKTAHALIRGGFLEAVESFQSCISVRLTERGRDALREGRAG